MNRIIRNLCSLSVLGMIPACTGYECESICGESGIPVEIHIEQDSYDCSRTKSSYSCGESDISDLQIFITDGSGAVLERINSDCTSGLSFYGSMGRTYLVYAVANAGKDLDIQAINDQESFEQGVSFSGVPSAGIPMICREPARITVMKGQNSVSVSLVRMVARIDFRIDRSRLYGGSSLSVLAVRIRDAAVPGSPDQATRNDLNALNRGQSISLYAFENLQGDLLPGNTDPWKKVPSRIPGAADRCSYIEVDCSYDSGEMSSDDITYRMYLGKNTTTNFDVCRNTVYQLTLVPTENEIYGSRGSWKIESDNWEYTPPVPPDPEVVTVTQYRLAVSPSSLSLESGESSGVSAYLQSRTGTRLETETDSQITDWSSWSSPGRDVTSDSGTSWSTSDSGIAAVSKGNVTAGTKPGTATVTASYRTGGKYYSASCTVTVTKKDVITRRLVITPSSTSLEEGESQSFSAILITTTDGHDDAGTDVTSSCSWSIVSGGQYIESTGTARYAWKNGPGSSTIRASYDGGEVTGEADISTGRPIYLVSLTASPSSIILEYDNFWSDSYSFTATYSNGTSETVTASSGLSVSAPWFVDEANGTVTANAPGKGDMTGSYTYRGVTMSGSIHIESIEEWFTVGLQFEIDQRGRSYTIHDITAVKNSHFSGPHDEKYVRLNAGEFSYDASGSISVEESGSSLIVTASGRGSLTISYRCPVSGEEVSDTVSF